VEIPGASLTGGGLMLTRMIQSWASW
jgi:hypothetical protein